MMRKALWIFALAILTAPAASNAALTVSLQPSQQTYLHNTNVTGFFDVFVTGTGDAVDLYSIALDIGPPNSGVVFRTSSPVTSATSAPDGYIFPTANISNFVNTTARQEYLDGPGPTTVAVGDTYGAGRVFFDIAAGAAPGTYVFDFDRSVSLFLAPGNVPIQTTFTGATVTILPANVPEPSTTLLLGLTGVVGFGVSRLRKRRQAATTAT